MRHLPVLSDLITVSRLKTFRSCQREHHLKYDLGYRYLRKEDTLHFGDLIHRGLEAWWLAHAAGTDRLEAARAAVSGEADPFDRVRATVLLEGYEVRWGDEAFEVLVVEAEFSGPLVNPLTGHPSKTWKLGGKIDVIAKELRYGRKVVIEHKTSSEDISTGADYWKRLRLDSQISVYFDGAAILGHDVEACVYDVIGKPGIRPSQVPILDDDGVKIVRDASGNRVTTKDGKKWRETSDSKLGYVLETRDETPEEYADRLRIEIANNPDRYYQRSEVVRLEEERAEAAYDAWSVARQIREGMVADRFPKNPDACVRYGRTCAFFGVCAKEASLDDPSTFEKRDNPHPELELPGRERAA
jgi:hypothetical protein